MINKFIDNESNHWFLYSCIHLIYTLVHSLTALIRLFSIHGNRSLEPDYLKMYQVFKWSVPSIKRHIDQKQTGSCVSAQDIKLKVNCDWLQVAGVQNIQDKYSFSSLQGVCCEEAFILLLFLSTVMEEHQVEEQWSFAAGAQLFQQGEPRYDVCVCHITDRTVCLCRISVVFLSSLYV